MDLQLDALSNDQISRLRAETPGADAVVHLNHAGSSLPPNTVLEAHIDHLRAEATMGGYEAADAAAGQIAAVYDELALLVGGSVGEIARFEHATAAWNALFWSLPMRPGQAVLTNEVVYGSDLVGMLLAAERRGVEIVVVPSAEDGRIDLDELERLLDGDVAAVCATHVPTNGGVVNPVAEIGARTRAAGVPYLLDACQSVGQLDIDVAAIGCDLLSTTGRKYLRGPRGTGFGWVGSHILERLQPHQPDFFGAELQSSQSFEFRPDARRFEYWEHAYAAWLGLGAAARLANELGGPAIEATVRRQGAALRTRLRDIGVTVHDLGPDPCGIVTASVPGVDAVDAKAALAQAGVNVTTTNPDGAFHDAERRSLSPMVRLSVHYLTTDDELDRATAVLAAL